METKSITDYVQSLEDIIPALQLGLLPDGIGQVYHKFAESDSIIVTPTIISTLQNQDPFNYDGDTLYISSSDDTDTQIMYIEGVEYGTGEIIGEYVALTGQTAKQLTNVFRTVFRGFNTNGTNLVGDVYVGSEQTPTAGVPATDNAYAHIPTEYNGKHVNQTLTSIFTIPKGFTGFVTNWYGTATKGKDVDMVAYARVAGGVFKYQERMFNFESSNQKILPWLRFPEGYDFKVEAITSQGTVDGSVSYDIVLLHNDYINKTRPLSFR